MLCWRWISVPMGSAACMLNVSHTLSTDKVRYPWALIKHYLLFILKCSIIWTNYLKRWWVIIARFKNLHDVYYAEVPLETSIMVLITLFPHPGWHGCLFDRPWSHLFWSGAQLSEAREAGSEQRPCRGRYDGNAIKNFKICLDMLLDFKFSCNLFLSSTCSWHQMVLSMICGFYLNISSVKCFSGVLEEAEFYNITSLIKLVKDKIRERDCKTAQVSHVKIVLLHI